MLNLTPVFGVAGGYLFLGERLAPLQWLGAGLILAAVLVIVAWPAEAFRRFRRPEKGMRSGMS